MHHGDRTAEQEVQAQAFAASLRPHCTPGAKQHRIVVLEEYLAPGR
ncbi:hypothetical protein [Kitasatospora sp. NPDC057936]